MDLDCVAKAVAQLGPKAKLDLVTIAAPCRFLAADRVGLDEVKGAVEFIEDELIARRDCLWGRTGMGLKCR
jgi:hypothetical protein